MASKLSLNLGEFLSKRTKSEKVLGFIAAFCVLLAIVHSFVIGPIIQRISEIDQKIETSRDDIKRDKRILSFKDRIIEEYSKSSNYLDDASKSSEEIIATLLRKIESTAQEYSITVKDIRPGDTEVKAQFKIYKTSLDCQGTLTDIIAFMNALEQSDYLFQISRYSLAPKSKGAEVLKATIDIARYLIPAKKDEEQFAKENKKFASLDAIIAESEKTFQEGFDGLY